MSEKARTELAVLAALAWADGEVSSAEAAELRRLSAEAELSPRDAAELEELLTSPVPLDRFEQLAFELRRTHPTAEDRRTALERAARLARADGRLAGEEERQLAILRALLDAGSETSFFHRVRSFVRGTRGESLPSPTAPGGPLPGADRERLTLAGMLAGRVLAGEPEPEPARATTSLVSAGLSLAEAEVLLAGIRRDRHDADRQRLCADLNRRSGEAERRRLLRAIFALAYRAEGVPPAQEREIRLISNYLWIDAEEFHRVRLEVAGGGG